MAAASVTPPGSLDLLQPGFSKTLLGTKLEDKYLCSACRNVLRRPFQAQCGHRYCSFCLSSILSSGPQNCAACVHEGIYEEGISILESSSAFPDNAARREVESLPAICPSEGCTWTGTLKEYEVAAAGLYRTQPWRSAPRPAAAPARQGPSLDHCGAADPTGWMCSAPGPAYSRGSCHEGHCPFMLTECPACKGLVRLGQKEHHLEHECPERSLSCRHCRAPCCPADMKAHLQVCPKFPLTCDGCGKKKIPREKFQDHVRTCGRCRVFCRFHAVGCPEMVESEKLQEHEAGRLREHLALLLGALLQAGPPPRHGHPLPGQPEAGWEASAPGPGPAPPTAAELLQRCEALERKTATFENIVCVLNREVERVAMTAEACGRQHRLDQDRIEALSNKVQQLERSIGLKDLAMADLEQKVHEMEASTFDGVFIWKISDFARKRQEAVAGRTPAIFSPAFYTSRYGYKMCLRAYLNGDGTGRGTHLSLFFVLMKGPHDALLRWPFNQKVTLMLLDQNNREHVIDAFRPDVTSSSFQRPVSDMNIASGCPLFCPVSRMEAKNSYVRDDAIFLKAIVDLTGL
ncbi:TNF receptor-associated factor 2 isoform X2 [Hippopotamus amphibius kiboko]|uniref:TNF receptor-associated factor 2 isoform X2 n=1 Tax=Hippopotamus amphibius kiboko TaxID=575201 RepID=UPI0025947419|nr:TNF receptor-associated factor 2 isoform X2 [Hippopotamus amphibius kiboko]